MSSRFVLVGICAWISVCLLVAGWIPEVSDNVSTLWLISGLMGLVSAVGLAEAIKCDMRVQDSLLKEYMQAAMTDGLTGVPNRQSLDRTLTSAMNSFHPKKHPLCLIMVDIDHFKAFNDQWGHQAGDAVIRCVAQGMAEFFKDDGFVARYGGEEFAVLLPKSRLGDVDKLAEGFRRHVKETACEFRDRTFQVTISCGVTEARAGDTPDSFVRRADMALYAAKKMGRDCIWAADPDALPEQADPLPAQLDQIGAAC